jgi:beta-lactamase class A
VSDDLRASIAGELSRLACDYALYFRGAGHPAILLQTCEVFPSASVIKLPMLLAWLYLQDQGVVSESEWCYLDDEPQVEGAGLSWLLRQRRIPFHDALLFMIALSDNLCANLVMRRVGLERFNQVFRDVFGLTNTRLERRFMDHDARKQGRENQVSASDCIRLFALRDALRPAHRALVDDMLAANDDLGLWLRNIPRDTVTFYHKTGSSEGILHDWGYTRDRELFLLTGNVEDERSVYGALDTLGPLLLAAP